MKLYGFDKDTPFMVVIDNLLSYLKDNEVEYYLVDFMRDNFIITLIMRVNALKEIENKDFNSGN